MYSFQRFGRGDKPIYDGTKFVFDTNNIIKHSLRIMYYETLKHYQPILNLVAAAGSRGPCHTEHVKQNCEFCGRNFFGNICYKNHQKPKSLEKNFPSVRV